MKKLLVVLLASLILVGCVSKTKISQESRQWAKYLGISEKYVVEIFDDSGEYDQDFCREKAERISCLSQQLSIDDSVVNKAILVIIRSNGGSLLGTLRICQAIEKIKYPVYTLAHQALSGGANILAAGAKGHRYVKSNTHVMIHLPIHEFPIKFEGNTKEIEKSLADWEKISDQLLADLYQIDEIFFESLAHYTCQPIEKIRQDLYEKKEIWLFREKIVEYGLADVILPIRPN